MYPLCSSNWNRRFFISDALSSVPHTMSLGASGLDCHLDTVRACLVPSDAEIQAAQHVIDHLKDRIQACIRPEKAYVGGSFRKKTCLARDFDVDMVVFLQNFSDTAV